MAKKKELEAETRKKRIDVRLEAAGWRVVPTRSETQANLSGHAVEEHPTENGPADYALFVGSRLLGVVEAKKLTVGPQNVLGQAERYSRGASDTGFDFAGFHVPFIYSTNGEVVWFRDVRSDMNTSRQVKTFHTPRALEELLDRDLDSSAETLATRRSQNENAFLRPYQKAAIAAVVKAIGQRKRQMLVAMATGTGKTFTTVELLYCLIKSGVARRVLFLVDRRALAAQSTRAFAAYEAEPSRKFNQLYEVYSQKFHRDDLEDDPKIGFDPKVLPANYLTNPQPGNAFVYVSTIQRMAISLFGRDGGIALGDETGGDDDAERLEIPIHAFDLIVADECHRGYTSAELSVWRNTLDHFDAIKVGLTATPAAHTKAYFTEIVYRYEYQQAVREGYLVDYDVVTVESAIRMKGVFLRQGEQVEVVDPDSGGRQLDLLEDERHYDTTDIERRVTAPDSNRKILEEIKKHALEHEQRYGRFPKTLIFGVNDIAHVSHADQLVRIAREVFGRGESLIQKITGSPTVDRPLQRIREFRNRPSPSIVVTVDMLSTGVDIPDLEFIVFLRPVKSRILFEQMLGRGTRKGEKFPEKTHFTVFDCFGGTLFQYFRSASAFTTEPPERPGKTIPQVIEDIWQNRDRDYNVRCLVRRLHRIDRELSGDGRVSFERFVPDGNLARYAKELQTNLKADFTATLRLLRNRGFQDLLVNYVRPPRSFVVATDVTDSVRSAVMLRDAAGREYKPDDYLAAFARFVQESKSEVEAIQILLDRPAQWGTDALSELRDRLTRAKERFTPENLERAHHAAYRKALVDIISMVKHAVRQEEPLLTAEERVARALRNAIGSEKLLADQRRWLDRIRAHLVVNLSIDKHDFEEVPVLSR